MKQILVVNLFVDTAKFKRQFQKLLKQVQDAGGNVVASDFESVLNLAPESVNEDYDGVILGGTEALFTRNADRGRFSNFIQYVSKISVPTLGICGGHQALALAYGGNVTKMQDSVQGYRTVILEDKDTLLAGLPRRIKVMQSHKEQVKPLPPGFVRTATSPHTQIEGMKHESLPLYGVQFHPERWNDENPAGKHILENFVTRIALSRPI